MDLTPIFHRQRKYWQSGATLDIRSRCRLLAAFEQAILDNADAVCTALQQDLGKHPFETWASEIAMVTGECRWIRRNLPRWSRPERVPGNLMLFGTRSSIQRQPLGQVLILSPWNYPLQLLFSPLTGAVAAGNTVILKPSPAAPCTVQIMEKIISEIFPPEQVTLVQGDAAVMNSLLDLPFDHIFVTGSTALGRHVAERAASRLIPVTLELGGKSPCIVDRSADLSAAARRIAWGKFLNAGQTCIAPDYLLVHRDLMEPLINELTAVIKRDYLSPEGLTCYSRIISPDAVHRLASLLDGGRIRCGGGYDPGTRFFEPTLLDRVKLSSPLMQEEIFGPLLPVIPWNNLDEAVRFVNRRPRPLALYCFGRDRNRIRSILESTVSGGSCINDTVLHAGNRHLPFGGTGASGQGRYHGKASYEIFSNPRAVLERGGFFDPEERFPPYTTKKFNRLRRFFR